MNICVMILSIVIEIVIHVVGVLLLVVQWR